jgi:DNA-directed RNA polymerase specialized sigma24 family protein
VVDADKEAAICQGVMNESELKPASPPLFLTTHWTVVLNAARPDSAEAQEALAKLCRDYWFPLYAYARKQGCDLHSAQDLTQEFFGRLIEKNYLGVADRRRGRFRWFLLTAFKCFLANEWDRSQAQKRGGGKSILSFDGMTAEERYRNEPQDDASPDLVYDRRWAADLLERARSRLRDEYVSAGRLDRLNHLEAETGGFSNPPAFWRTGARGRCTNRGPSGRDRGRDQLPDRCHEPPVNPQIGH